MDEFNVKNLRDEIFQQYQPYVHRLAGIFFKGKLPGNVHIEDLISVGNIGLLDAIDRYTPDQKVKFETYAEYRIKGEILDELRRLDPRGRLHNDVMKEVAKAIRKLGPHSQESEIAKSAGITLERYRKVRKLDALNFVPDHDSETYTVADKTVLCEYIKINKRDQLEELHDARAELDVIDAILTLPPRHQTVIRLYYYDDLSMAEIAKLMDLTESRISQIIQNSKTKMKPLLRGKYGSTAC
ncbi:MAG: sigma-70 family RNA polymerase sigma factor [Bdellovibrio sp.]|nr:sigma-70 family RNA polymerase sigma factor [Bdellovibrio sp.]